MADLIIYTERTNIIDVDVGMDVSADTLTSEIRTGKSTNSTLIATWDVTFKTDGTDGKLVLRLDDSELMTLTEKSGWMDMKRVSGGEPYPVFAPIKVVFQDSVTQ